MAGKKKIDFTNHNIIVTNHAVDQWNNRVDHSIGLDKTSAKEQLKIRIRYNTPKHIIQNFYELESNVILVAFMSDDNIIIPTVYGTTKKNPSLRNFKSYVKNSKKYGRINLSQE